MRFLGALCALIVLAGAAAAPVSAREGYVLDQAGILSAGTVSNLNARISNFAAQTHKEVVVQTVTSLGGLPVREAAGKAFTEQNVNGVLIFIAKDDRKDFIVPDRSGVQAGWFSPEIFAPIYASMGSQFKDGDYDGGVTTAVDSVLGIYRSHMSSLGGGAVPVRAPRPYANSTTSGGFHLSMFWIIIMVIAGFLILRSILRAMSAPRPPYGQLPPGAPGYGQQGYGPGYGGMGGGGGSFFSGLLGGLGGAFLGNELFGGNRGGGGGDQGGSWGGDNTGGAAPDAGGWTSDAGQGDVSGGGGGGDWSGGGFGGGDSGGGGGDSGGGW